jgi:uncharacterized membrane protein YqjE
MTTINQPEPSLRELVGELGADLSQLVRKEVELAKTEAREEAQRLTRAAALGAVAGVAALLALILLSMALAWWIDEALNTAVAFALVGAMWIAVTAVAVTMARSAIAGLRPMPATADAIKGAVTGERATDDTTHRDSRSINSTHQISDTRRTQKETAS